MYREFEGSDSCVEIIDPEAFFRHISVSLNALSRVTFQGLHRVTYSSREEQWNGSDWGTHPALLKEPSFRAQAELRAIWTPDLEHTIEPMIIGNFEIPAACKTVSRGTGDVWPNPSLQSAKLHGHDPWAYLKDLLTRLPGHMNRRIEERLPHQWQPQS